MEDRKAVLLFSGSVKSALGAKYRRLKAKLGAPKAIVAMAHHLARLVYRMQRMYAKSLIDKTLRDHEERSPEALAAKNRGPINLCALNFPELAWLEVLPSPTGRQRRENYIVLESLEKAFERIRGGEHLPDFPSEIKVREARRARNQRLSQELGRF